MGQLICICMDLKALHQSVMSEIHPLPRVYKILAQMDGAAYFTKLDAKLLIACSF